MMDFPLTIPAVVRRAATHFPDRAIVSRKADRSLDRRTYASVIERSRRLSAALRGLGVRRGDRVATLAWSAHQHLETYLAVPSMGAVLHTLNLRLHPDDLTHIVRDADDRVVIVDESLLPLLEKIRPRAPFAHVIVTAASGEPTPYLDYEALIAAADPARAEEPVLDEQDAAAMCYTSGTTGRPKGVLYSHRATVLHAFAQGLRGCLSLSDDDTVLPIVPMFHVNAWGLPYSSTLFGCAQVLPGPHLDARSVAELLAGERVTLTAGVPTVWMALLQELDAHPGTYDLRALRSLVIGGSAAPLSLIRGFAERHGITVVHAWGMTEMSPVGSVCHLPGELRGESADVQFRYRARQGMPLPFVEIRARGENGLVPWDDHTLGELEVRGPWVAERYYHDGDEPAVDGEIPSADGAATEARTAAGGAPGPRGAAGGEPADRSRFTDDGWFKTGDIVRIAPSGCLELADRSKDLVKSGGEWISSVALENALMGHPSVAEAAVVAVPHPKWDERPLAVVVLKPGQTATLDELTAFLAPHFAKWWLPDRVEYVEAIPRTSAGKFLKSALRERFRTAYGGG